jgi:hypothetical protein
MKILNNRKIKKREKTKTGKIYKGYNDREEIKTEIVN